MRACSSEQGVCPEPSTVGRLAHASATPQCLRAVQALCLLHAKSRLAMSSAQYLQLTTARACEEPACLPAATHVLVALMAVSVVSACCRCGVPCADAGASALMRSLPLRTCHHAQGNEEAQALFVTTGGLDMLLTRTLQHTQPPQQQQAGAAGGKAGADGSSSSSGNALLRQLLVFLQLLAAIISDAVKKGACCILRGRRGMLVLVEPCWQGALAHAAALTLLPLPPRPWPFAGAHPSTQRAALALVARHLGPRVSQGLTAALPSHVLAAAQQPAHAAAGVGGGVSSVWGLSEQLAAAVEAKADELLEAALAQRHQQPQSAAR